MHISYLQPLSIFFFFSFDLSRQILLVFQSCRSSTFDSRQFSVLLVLFHREGGTLCRMPYAELDYYLLFSSKLPLRSHVCMLNDLSRGKQKVLTLPEWLTSAPNSHSQTSPLTHPLACRQQASGHVQIRDCAASCIGYEERTGARNLAGRAVPFAVRGNIGF